MKENKDVREEEEFILRWINGYQDEPIGSVCGTIASLKTRVRRQWMKKNKKGENDLIGGLMWFFFSVLILLELPSSPCEGATPASAVQSFNPCSLLAQERSLNSELPAGMAIPHAARNPGQVSIIWQETKTRDCIRQQFSQNSCMVAQRSWGFVTEVISWPDKMRMSYTFNDSSIKGGFS